MSHATVLVKVTAERLKKSDGDLEAAIAAMMAPYEESPKEGNASPYVSFKDCEPEYRARYETEKTKRVVLPDGKTAWPWSDKAKALLGIEDRKSYDIHVSALKNDPRTFVEMTFEEIYGSFEAFMTDYASMERDPVTGKYGYYRNQNKTWDWYVIGGRWSGFFPLKKGASIVTGKPSWTNKSSKAGHGDVVHIRDIDMDAVAVTTRQDAEKFYAEYSALLANPTDRKLSAYGGPRMYAIDLGLIRVVQGPAEGEPGKTIASCWRDHSPFIRDDDDRKNWTDVLTIIGKEEFLAKYMSCFCPLITYAALDDAGWHAPGKMGWFGCDNAQADDKLAFNNAFVDTFIKTATDDDLLVLVDYHI